MDAGGDVAVAYYTLSPGIATFTHTEVPYALQGQGIASRLIRGALEAGARRRAQGHSPLLVRFGLYCQTPGVR